MLTLAAGCALSTTQHGDAGPDAFVEDAATLPDANEDDASEADAGCDVSPIPSPLAALDGEFRVIDRESGLVPAASTGGDPRGVWVFDTATFWVEREATTMFNPYASSVSGSAWIAIDDASFRLDYELVTTLVGTAVGTIVRTTSTRAHARYRIDREQLEPTGAVCTESNDETIGDPGRMTFTVTGDRIALTSEVSASSGPLVLVLEGTRGS